MDSFDNMIFLSMSTFWKFANLPEIHRTLTQIREMYKRKKVLIISACGATRILSASGWVSDGYLQGKECVCLPDFPIKC